MKPAIVLDQNDVKKLIAEKYGVTETSIIKSQYSYIVVQEQDEQKTTE